MKKRHQISLNQLVLFCLVLSVATVQSGAQEVNFERKIQPIQAPAKFLNDIADARFSPSVKSQFNLNMPSLF